MSEIINVYKNGITGGVPIDRKEFYTQAISDWKTKKQVESYCEVIQIFLFNKRGEIILQRRSKDKAHNPNLLDKSIGGHVTSGDSIVFTCMVETIQELQIPSIVTESDSEFMKTYSLLERYLDTICVLKHIDTSFCDLVKIINGEEILIGNKGHLYFGVYDGKIRFADNEVRGMSFYSISELSKEITEHPEFFTKDLLFYFKNYNKEIELFVSKILE